MRESNTLLRLLIALNPLPGGERIKHDIVYCRVNKCSAFFADFGVIIFLALI